MESIKLIIVLLLFYITNTNAAVTVTSEYRNGKEVLVATKAINTAKNCNPKIKKLIAARAEWLASGEVENLRQFYSPKALIYTTSRILEQPKKHETYSIKSLIEQLKKSRSQQDGYLHLQLNGQCKIQNNNIIYSGTEVEKLTFKGIKPLISTTILRIVFDGASNKIISENHDNNIKVWPSKK